ncbi:MAG TPA: extracellular solute-binding protein, partial [Gammaproteobacteria bacterium]
MFTLTGLLAACDTQQEEVNIYSYRNERLIKPILDQFTEDTGIKVNLVTGEADALFQRLQSEGKNTPADVLLTTDAGRLYRAKEAGLLQPLESPVLIAAIPAPLRDPDNQWYGLSYRARVVIYNKEKVDPAELSTYEDLAHEKWRDRICIRSSGNIYNQSLLASLIAHLGADAAQAWAQGVVTNMARPPQGNDTSQITAAAVGECDLAVANTYYYGGLLSSENPEDREIAGKVAVFFPNQNGRGTHINVSGAGITRYAKNAGNAKRLLEYLAGDKAQAWYAQVNHEYPVKPSVEV